MNTKLKHYVATGEKTRYPCQEKTMHSDKNVPRPTANERPNSLPAFIAEYTLRIWLYEPKSLIHTTNKNSTTSIINYCADWGYILFKLAVSNGFILGILQMISILGTLQASV
jgi:hypothetical protein